MIELEIISENKFHVSAHGDGFNVNRAELLDFVVYAAKILGLPSIGCVDCGESPVWVTDHAYRRHLVCQKHREIWDKEQHHTFSPIKWKKI